MIIQCSFINIYTVPLMHSCLVAQALEDSLARQEELLAYIDKKKKKKKLVC